MRKLIYCLFFLLAVLAIPPSSFAEGKVVRFASLDWPPYSGASLPEQGANITVAKAAFAAMGYELEVMFYPWARTIMVAKTNQFLGYFPEYYAKEIEKDFIFSDPIGDSPLGFAERKDNSVSWTTLNDLTSVKAIGVVRGYVNTEDFDKMAAAGLLKVEPVVEDSINLRKVAARRIPLAVIDKYVLQYILKTDENLIPKSHLLQFNPRLLESKKLYLCFQKSDDGRRYLKIFNDGLKKIDVDKITKDYFEKVLK